MNSGFRKTGDNSNSQAEEGFAVGYSINDKYIIEDQLGRGGMGLTYLAHDVENINRKVVIKTIFKSLATAEGNLAFLKEGEALGRINHDGVVKLYDKGEDFVTELPFLVMEYVKGAPLSSIIKRGQMDLEKAVKLAEQIALALNAAHREKILHRDLKPANIMFVESEHEDDKIKLIDFGVAKVADSVVSGGSTVFGSFKGTLQYASPEQLSGFQTEVGETFNLAALVYEMLTQIPPFPITVTRLPDESTESLNGRAFAQIRTLQQQGADSPRRINSQISEAVAEVVLKGLAYDSSNRYQTPLEFARELKKSRLEPESEITSKTEKSWAKPLIFLPIAILLFAALGWLAVNFLSTSKPISLSNSNAQTVPANAEIAETVFSYSFDVQKMKDNLPTGETFTTADKSKISAGDKFNLKIEREKGGRFYLLEQNGENLKLTFPNSYEDAKNISRWNVAKESRTYWLIWSTSEIELLENPQPDQTELKRFLNNAEKTFSSKKAPDRTEIQTNKQSAIYHLSF